MGHGIWTGQSSDRPSHIRVVAAVIEREGKLLVCQRPAHKRHGGLWEFPGGKIEPHEEPLAALARELREELGVRLDVTSAIRLGEFEDCAVNEPGRRVRAQAYLCKVDGVPAPCAEIEELAWVSLAGAHRVPVAPLSARHIIPAFAAVAGRSVANLSQLCGQAEGGCSV